MKEKCSVCDNYEHGVFRRPIICGECVQMLLGYEVMIHKYETPPYNVLRAVLSDKRGKGKGVGRVGPNHSIQRCSKCGTIHWQSSSMCPTCGEDK